MWLVSWDLSDDTIVAKIIGAAARHARCCVLPEAGHLAAATDIVGLAGAALTCACPARPSAASVRGTRYAAE
jgi:hypothetical protein